MTKTIDLEKYTNPAIHTFDSNKDGETLTVLGAVHGNEPCGPNAINRIMDHIKNGDITITNGKLVTMPVVNSLARERNVRFIERNLNRFLYPKDKPDLYEDYLDLALCPVLDKTDYLLDLHSYNSQGDAFIFLGDRNDKEMAYARALGIQRTIYGWADAMKASDDIADKRQAMGTVEYAREQGAIALTLECGTHSHPYGADVGFNAILNALRHLNIAEFSDDLFVTSIPDSEPYDIKMKGMFVKHSEGAFTKEWNNMEFVTAGTILANFDNGEQIVMPEDGFIVLPLNKTAIDDAWFFWGVPEEV